MSSRAGRKLPSFFGLRPHTYIHLTGKSAGSRMVVHGIREVAPMVADVDKPRGIFGLINHGSMCWFNSLIQIMLSLPNFITTVRRCTVEDPTKYPVMTELDKFLAAAETCNGDTMSAMPILTELMRACPGFGGRQEDASEGLILLLDKMHPDVSCLFEATYQMDIYCDTCRAVVGLPRMETMLIIPMERDFITIGLSGDPLEQYLSGHMIHIAGWKCPACGNESANNTRDAMRVARLAKRPEILIVSFNKYGGKWAGPAYGQNIELVGMAKPAAALAAHLYSLTGVIRHFGGSQSGHYDAICRRPAGVWLFDDVATQGSTFHTEDVDYMLIYSQSADVKKN